MDAEKMINVKLDTRIKAYQSFFDPDWAKTMSYLTNGTKLEDAATALSVSWFATANAYAMPWRMVQNLIGFEQGFIRGEKSYTDRILQRLAMLIPQRMSDSLSNMKRNQLSEVINGIGAEYKVEMAAVQPTDAEGIFASLLNGSDGVELHTSIAASQRTCYGAIYFGYEDYLSSCVGLAKGESDYRFHRHKDLVSDATKEFGLAIADLCVSHAVVKIARLARNALAHSGGRLTKELQTLPHDFPLGADDTIHIVAAHNQNLFNELKMRAYKLAEKAGTMPQFR